jgi:hypothetical protein
LNEHTSRRTFPRIAQLIHEQIDRCNVCWWKGGRQTSGCAALAACNIQDLAVYRGQEVQETLNQIVALFTHAGGIGPETEVGISSAMKGLVSTVVEAPTILVSKPDLSR